MGRETIGPQIIMGISGKPQELMDVDRVKKWAIGCLLRFRLMGCCRNRVPVIKRFTGGGTVVVDPNVFYVTFILNQVNLI